MELYNVKKDRAEKENIAADYPERVKKLSEKLDAWKKALPSTPCEHCLSKSRTKK